MLRGFIRGFTRYAGQIFGDAFENNALATNFGTADFEDRYLQQEVGRIWNLPAEEFPQAFPCLGGLETGITLRFILSTKNYSSKYSITLT